MTRCLRPILLLALLVAPCGCHRERASARSCERIFDRVLALELREKGFRDPAYFERKRRELKVTLAAELRECRGRPLRPRALECVESARDVEQISHVCLRGGLTQLFR